MVNPCLVPGARIKFVHLNMEEPDGYYLQYKGIFMYEEAARTDFLL
jgi:hypothetical protein